MSISNINDAEKMAEMLARFGNIPNDWVTDYTDTVTDIGELYEGAKPGDVQSPAVGFEITHKGKAPEGTVVEYGGKEIDVGGRLVFEITGPNGPVMAYVEAVDREGKPAKPSNFYDVRYVIVPGR